MAVCEGRRIGLVAAAPAAAVGAAREGVAAAEARRLAHARGRAEARGRAVATGGTEAARPEAARPVPGGSVAARYRAIGAGGATVCPRGPARAAVHKEVRVVVLEVREVAGD